MIQFGDCLKKKEEQQEVETAGNERTPSPAPSGAEQTETSTEELDSDSHESDPSPSVETEPGETPAEEPDAAGTACASSLSPCGTEQHTPPPIDPIRRLFRQEEQDDATADGESLPSLLSYGAKPSPMDSIRRLIQHR